jgi:hypothetical protein
LIPAGPTVSGRWLPVWSSIFLFGAVGGYIALLMWSMGHQPYASWSPILVAPVLFFSSLPILATIARRSDRIPSFGLLSAALALKLIASLAYLWITEEIYHGEGDYYLYSSGGADLAESYRAGHWTFDVDGVPGYGFIQIVTGIVFRLIGTSLTSGFLFFSWLAFWGLVLMILAARTAVPEADIGRYSRLVLFLPSTIYWSSALGKDAWMMLALGITAVGAARLLSRRRGAFPILGLGLTAATMVRPHVALMLFVAVALGYLVRRSRKSLIGPMSKAAGVAVLALVGLIISQHATSFLQIDDFSVTSVNQALDQAGQSSAGGNASLEPPVGGALTQLPWAIVTVTFRPFLWEAHNAQAIISALEGTFLAVLCWRARARLRRLPAWMKGRPYLTVVSAYSAMFVFAFSSFANLGTIARERIQLFPLLLLLLCLPMPSRVLSSPSVTRHDVPIKTVPSLPEMDGPKALHPDRI